MRTLLRIDPAIIPRIKCYALGARFNVGTHVWGKNEFNIRNDLNAFDFLLDSSADLTMLPLDAVRDFQFDKDETYKKLDSANAIHNLLKSRWQETNPQDQRRTLWDLASVEAYLRPQFFELQSVDTPPENTRRKISAYGRMNVPAATADFWTVIRSLTRGSPS